MNKNTALFVLTMAIAATSGALTNSTPALDNQYETQVMIRTEARDPDGGSVPAYCNATLISPRLVITAAHCVAHAWLLKDAHVDLNVGRYKFVTRPDGVVARIGYVDYLKAKVLGDYFVLNSLESKLLSTKFSTQIAPGEDVALIVLRDSLSLAPDFKFRKPVARAALAKVTANISAYAPAILTINFWAQTSTDTKRIAPLNNVSYNSEGWIRSVSNSRVEEMDSGGGLMITIDSEQQLLAVVKGLGQSFAGNWDAYSLVGARACDLANKAKLGADELAIACR